MVFMIGFAPVGVETLEMQGGISRLRVGRADSDAGWSPAGSNAVELPSNSNFSSVLGDFWIFIPLLYELLFYLSRVE